MNTFYQMSAKFIILIALLTQLNHAVALPAGKFHIRQGTAALQHCRKYVPQLLVGCTAKQNKYIKQNTDKHIPFSKFKGDRGRT